MYFAISSSTYTNCVVADSYAINKDDIYTSWVDGNGTTHRDITRTKIRGTLSMYFRNETLQQNFLTRLTQSKTAEGWYLVTLTVNNDPSGDLVTIHAYLDYHLVKKQVGIRDTFEQFVLTVEEV